MPEETLPRVRKSVGTRKSRVSAKNRKPNSGGNECKSIDFQPSLREYSRFADIVRPQMSKTNEINLKNYIPDASRIGPEFATEKPFSKRIIRVWGLVEKWLSNERRKKKK